MFLGTLGGLLSCQKKFQELYEEIVDKKFGGIRWIRPKLRYKKTLKMSKIEKNKIHSPIAPAGEVQSARSGLSQSVSHLNKSFLKQN